MKKLVLVLFAIAFVAASGYLYAGDYHTGDTLICSDCHVMHYSQSHGYNADGSGNFVGLAAGPHHYLLRNEINDLCLSCHDNQIWAADVFEGPTGSEVRQAGGLNEVGGNGQYPPPTGHTLNSTDVAPGGTWANVDGLNCVDCHNAHGYHPSHESAYRNFQYSPGGAYPYPGLLVSYNDADDNWDGTKDVFLRDKRDYDVAITDFNKPVVAESNYAAWCKGCHTDFHGDPGGTEVGGVEGDPGEWEEFIRHPASVVVIGASGGGHSSASEFAGDGTKLNYAKVMTNTENWTPSDPVDVTDHTPSCFSCHKGHGNQNAFALITMDGYDAGGITEEGTGGGVYKDSCKQCHVQG
jgi:hypothetical protein